MITAAMVLEAYIKKVDLLMLIVEGIPVEDRQAFWDRHEARLKDWFEKLPKLPEAPQ